MNISILLIINKVFFKIICMNVKIRKNEMLIYFYENGVIEKILILLWSLWKNYIQIDFSLYKMVYYLIYILLFFENLMILSYFYIFLQNIHFNCFFIIILNKILLLQI